MSLFGSPNAYGEYSPPAQPHSETSQAAAKAIKPVLNVLQQAVLDFLRKCGDSGATDEEGIDATAITASSYRPRRIELCDAGLVRDSGRKRETRSGRAAAVWVAV